MADTLFFLLACVAATALILVYLIESGLESGRIHPSVRWQYCWILRVLIGAGSLAMLCGGLVSYRVKNYYEAELATALHVPIQAIEVDNCKALPRQVTITTPGGTVVSYEQDSPNGISTSGLQRRTGSSGPGSTSGRRGGTSSGPSLTGTAAGVSGADF